ncbi:MULTISPECIES: XRE family transcriptional regulator [unclassified Facklamia]|uniref:XRE family transcriptional regulator n=1 Tax=Aerococcaceae TaxID=186827 RepID=UPI0013BAA401|nr:MULTISPECIES: XRE family transcriptional regulator [unclassified Facklamia]NEW65305.1 XRE family transcriptional regulator [Facklamia sp. 252]NEW68795.1 XRE family transcriptional regulator [Facklamia sp. 253]QQD66106.1 hypothetical protein JDW14_03085 [Aerococcaceae bacterium zg-252]
MNVNRKRPPYNEFKAWMITHSVTRNELKKLLGLTDSTLSHRLNGTGADFSLDEIRLMIGEYGNDIANFFYNLG